MYVGFFFLGAMGDATLQRADASAELANKLQHEDASDEENSLFILDLTRLRQDVYDDLTFGLRKLAAPSF